MKLKSLSESDVQNMLREYLFYKKDWWLQRNNVGVMIDKTGRPVRYGLCNDSQSLNKSMKSSDLIGLRKILITQDMVGQTIGQFVALEVKKEGWKYKETEREMAQKAYLDEIIKMGGYAKFVTSIDDIK